MRRFIIPVLVFIIASCSSGSKQQFELTNEQPVEIKDKGIVFTRLDLSSKMEIPEGTLPLMKSEGKVLPSQADDLDGDGKWDELFFLVDFEANEMKTVELSFVNPDEYPQFKPRTNLRFAKKNEDYREVTFATRETHAINTETQKVWQMEGMAWENDKVGFRNYFDRRNGMDIFGKVTTEMVLDEVGYKDNPSYHEFNPDWGVDVLKVGTSLGAGSIAYMYNDSLYRVGDNGNGTCRVLVEGPLRSIFRFEFSDWEMGDQTLGVIQDVMIQAGTYYYETRVWYTGHSEALQLVTGIVNMKSDAFHEVDAGEAYKAFYTHDKQSEDGTILGMGLKVSAEDFAGTSVTPDTGDGITETYCVHMNASPGEPVTYRFYTVWERENAKWKDPKAFEELLKE